MAEYNHKKIEKKWQKAWEKSGIYKIKETKAKQKYYILDMFPYPSGEGLHVGHPRGYIATDVYSRYKRMNGFNVLHPMGWDAFGLPAENYAIKHKIHPKIAVNKNIATYKRQLKAIGFDYDWSREINTTDPNYYKWTQWMFLQMFKKGLVFQSYEPILWCPSCKTGLALEDLDGNLCERCGTLVEKKPMRQWVLKITKYAERILDDLKSLDWPQSIIEQQKNWIGRSEGAVIKFDVRCPVKGEARQKRQMSDVRCPAIEVFTTRLDTIFGCTYLVVAPEHKIIKNLEFRIGNLEEVKKYIEESKNKSEIQRTDLAKEKTGIELKGVRAINPFNNGEAPVFVADYVLGSYGTGAVMAVPAHDERDFEFAKKYNLPIKMVVCPNYPKPICPVLDKAFIEDGHLVDSGQFTGMASEKAREEMAKWLVKNKLGEKKINYKLQDWVFSRQRYWGEPIPIIHCDPPAGGCGAVAVSEKDLPVKLPSVKSYEPTGTGESPLAAIEKWVNVKCPNCGGPAKRETNTMPQWAGSCWYYIAYICKQNSEFRIKNSGLLKKWLPVDFYVGGAEHATRHLIYARFWHKFLYDIGVVSVREPFQKLANQGLILAQDGRKMSKRWGNVISPDDIIENYGADTLRVYEMFMGSFEQAINWNTDSMVGSRRFLERVYKIKSKIKNQNSKLQFKNQKLEKLIHKTIKKITEDIESFKFNTAISALMILLNEMEKEKNIPLILYSKFLILLSPFAPHLAEELWQIVRCQTSDARCKSKSVHLESWPEYDKRLIKEETVKIPVQINGKVRAEIEIEADAGEEKIKELALANKTIKKWLNNKEIKKFVYIKNKIVNIVI